MAQARNIYAGNDINRVFRVVYYYGTFVLRSPAPLKCTAAGTTGGIGAGAIERERERERGRSEIFFPRRFASAPFTFPLENSRVTNSTPKIRRDVSLKV